MSLFRWYIQKREKLILRLFKNNVFIAIVRLDDYEAARRMLLGFADTVAKSNRKNHDFRSVVAYGKSDDLRKKLDDLRKKLEEAFIDPHTMVFSIGAETTLLAKEVSTQLSSQKPAVFIDIKDPQRLGIIKSYATPDNNFFGLVDSVDHVEDHVYRLLRMIPRLEHAFLLYDPLQEMGSSKLEKDKFIGAFATRSVVVTTIPITSQEMTASTTEETVKRIYKKYKYNAIVTLRDPLLMSSMHFFSQIAERYQAPLYSADPESVLSFAAIGSGYNGYDMGGKVAERSLHFMHERKRPLFIPTIFYTMDYKSYANRMTMIRQGLEITDENREWFRHHVTYAPF